jgi:hypothetical protein
MSRWRDAVLDAVLPGTRPAVDFWPRFRQAAPLHLRVAMGVTSAVVGVAPLALGHRRPLSALSAAERDEVVQRLADMPVTSELLEIAKVVACFAHFDDPAVQSGTREDR